MRKRKSLETDGSAWLMAVVNATQDAVISIDAERRITLFNPAAERMFGYPAREIEGQKVNVLMDEPYASEHDAYVDRYERTGEAHAIGRIRIVSGRRKSGETFPMELSVAKVALERTLRYVAVIRDVSDRVRLQGELLHAERLATLGATAAMLAHEIGNPLNGISLNVNLLERRLSRSGATGDEAVAAVLSTVNSDIDRLRRLLTEVRGFSRNLRLELRPIRLTHLVEDVLRLQVFGGHIQVERSFESQLPEIVADADKLKQVFLNLFKNAVEAMPGGGVLTIRGEPRQRHVVVEVIDTGLGIAEGVDPFEPFRTTKKEGTGLGLS
ncbi:MAG: nitrogen regulation protein NR(II), partial [Vicinamibacteria bacterium]